MPTLVTSVHCPLSDKIRFILCRPKLHPVHQSVPGGGGGGGGALKTIKPCTRDFRTSACVTSRFL